MKLLFDLLARSPFWAIRSEAVLTALASLSRGPVAGGWEAAKPSMMGKGGNKIQVIPIEGVLTKDGPCWYGSSYDSISKAVEQAAVDPEVSHIVLSVDSPGGEVTGCLEAAQAIAAAAKIKPVTAMVHGMSASAGYYLTSQARDIVLTPSGEVGSVGVRMMHVDYSKMLENEGIKVTELASGNYKTEWSPYHPLSQEAIEAEMPRLASVHTEFIGSVASGRGERLSQQMRETRIGEARMFSGNDALKHGLVDRLQSSREFYKSIVPESAQTDAVTPGFPRAQAHAHRVRKA